MTETKVKRWTMAEIKAANAAAGFNFFSRETMKYFASRIEGGPYCGPGGVFFVTSEKTNFGPECNRDFTVREFFPDSGDVRTLVGGLRFRDDARQAARDAARDR